MSVVDNCLALTLAMSVGACGRIGFENQSGTDAGLVEMDGDLGGDGRAEGGPDGGSVQCEGSAVSNCAGTTVGISIGGSTSLGMNLSGYATPLIPECGSGPVAEGRIRILAPAAPAIVSFEVVADIDIMLSVIADDCEGASLQCTVIAASSNGSLQIATQPGEVFIVSAASNESCGDLQLLVLGTAQGS